MTTNAAAKYVREKKTKLTAKFKYHGDQLANCNSPIKLATKVFLSL